MTTIKVKDADGVDRTVASVPNTGVAAASAALPVVEAIGTPASRAGTTTGGVSQEFAPANAARRGFAIQAPATAALWVNKFGVAASADPACLMIPAGGLYESPPGGGGVAAINVFCATDALDFYGEEW
jgi:hypothetical protein